jgi:hypothetical protein
MNQVRRRQPKYRHVAPALALMATVVVAMAGITVSRLSRIPAERPWVGVRHAEAASDVVASHAAAREGAARVAPVDAVTVRPPRAAEDAVAAKVPGSTPPPVVEAESPTLPLSPATLMVGLAAARSRTLASASPRPAPPAECNGAIAGNFDADIVAMTGVPGRNMYYRSPKNAKNAKNAKDALASACGRGAQTASATP